MTVPEAGWTYKPSDLRWIDLVAADPASNIFHHPSWLALLESSYGYRPFVVAVPEPGGEIGAGLPFMEVNNPLKGRRWAALPFSDHCKPLARSEESLDHLGSLLCQLADKGANPAIELRGFAPSAVGQTTDEYAFHMLDLRPGPADLLRGCHPMHRRNIKYAAASGVRIEMGASAEHLEQFYRLHLITRRKQGVPIQPKRFFRLLRENLLERGLGFILLAYHGDRCIAAAVFLHWQKTLTYKYGASDPEALNLRPNNLLFWNAIEWGYEHGYDWLDMGKSDLDNNGLRTFKRRWGAEESPLSYTTLSAGPVHTGNGKLMGLMNTVIHNSPPWVCRLTGELLYRYVG